MMHWHWQNLAKYEREEAEHRGEAYRGQDWVHGRAWLRLGGGRMESYRTRTINPSWRLGRFRPHFGLTFTRGGCEEDYTFGLVLGWLSLYLTFSGWRAYEALPRSWGRTTGVIWFEDRLRLEWNCDSSEWSNERGPKHGKEWSCCPRDWLLGQSKYSREDLSVVAVPVVMPERAYLAQVTMHQDSWKRPRWPWPKRLLRATIDVPAGIPFPGKGENSWDCGEDATYSMTCPAADPEEAARKLRDSVLLSRLRYGGKDWVPDAYRKRRTAVEASLSPQQRKAVKRLRAGKRTFRPTRVELEGRRYEIHPGGTVYDVTPEKKTGKPALRKVEDLDLRERVAQVARDASEQT